MTFPSATSDTAPWILPALLLWGAQSGHLWIGAALGIALEGRRWIPFRWEIPQSDFNRFWNFNVILFIGTGLYLFFAQQGPDNVGALFGASGRSGRLEGIREISATAVSFIRWLPLVFFPFMLAHAWSHATTIPWLTFSLYQQKRAQKQPQIPLPEWASRQIHPTPLYMVMVLVASTTSVEWPALYLVGLASVIGIALWSTMNRRFKAWLRFLALVGCLGASLAIQQWLAPIRDAFQKVEDRFLQAGGNTGFDQVRTYTAIGNVGNLKQSGGIVLRIRSPQSQHPGLLREATFNRFKGQAWNTTHRDFTELRGSSDNQHWRIQTNSKPGKIISIARYTADGVAPVALPENVLALSEIPLTSLERNAMGSVRLKEGPDLVTYSVEYGEGGGLNLPPEADDLDLTELSPQDQEVIRSVAKELQISRERTQQESIARIERYFATGFTYSLWQDRPATQSTNRSPLVEFLQKTRSGHCEFYATATVLLLRAAGIPSRYAVGFSCSERLNDAWVARGRDAHAWTVAFVNDRWISIDTTPGIWRDREQQRRSLFQPVMDWFSEAKYQFTLWRQESDLWRVILIAVGIVGLAWLAWRQLRGSRWRRTKTRTQSTSVAVVRQGLDSEFFAVIRQIEIHRGERLAHETLSQWLRRLMPATSGELELLTQALHLHERYRFDPDGLSSAERLDLANLSAQALAIPSQKSAPK